MIMVGYAYSYFEYLHYEAFYDDENHSKVMMCFYALFMLIDASQHDY